MWNALKKSVAGMCLLYTLFCFDTTVEGHEITLATGEWVPYTSEQLEDYGEFTRLVSLVFKEMNHSVKFAFYPWRRCFDAVEKGYVFAAFPYSYTEERAKKVWFSDPLSCSKSVFFYYEGRNIPEGFSYAKLEDLKDFKIGGNKGYFYEETFNNANLQVDYSNKEISSIEKLRIGRIDLMPLNERVGWAVIQKSFPDESEHFRTLDKPLSENGLRLIVSRSYPNSKTLLSDFNSALKRAVEKKLIIIDPCQ